MKALGANSDDSQINSKPVAGTHLPDEMGVVFEIHSSGFATTVAGIAEANGRIERVARVVEHRE